MVSGRGLNSIKSAEYLATPVPYKFEAPSCAASNLNNVFLPVYPSALVITFGTPGLIPGSGCQ